MPGTAPESMVARYGSIKTQFRDCYGSDNELIPSAVDKAIVITFMRVQMDGVAPGRIVTITGAGPTPIVLRPGAGHEITIGGGEAIMVAAPGDTVTIGSTHDDSTYCEVLTSYYEV